MNIIREYFPGGLPLATEVHLDEDNTVIPNSVSIYPLFKTEGGDYMVGEGLDVMEDEEAQLAQLFNKRVKRFPDVFNLNKHTDI